MIHEFDIMFCLCNIFNINSKYICQKKKKKEIKYQLESNVT